MENFTRVSDSIRTNKSLTASEKLFIGYLQTYQLSPDGTPTNNYCFLKQEELAEELGESLSTIKRMIISLSSKGIIFQSAARNYNKSGYQFKNRKATILVDEYNPLPTELEVPKKEPKKVSPKVEVVVPEPVKEVAAIKQLTIEDELEDRGLPLVIEAAPIVESEHKVRMREEFAAKFKYPLHSGERNITGGEFHSLTYYKFQGKVDWKETSEIIKTLNNKDFDLFWNIIQELKQKCITNKNILA